jgi:hypothetical protein
VTLQFWQKILLIIEVEVKLKLLNEQGHISNKIYKSSSKSTVLDYLKVYLASSEVYSISIDFFILILSAFLSILSEDLSDSILFLSARSSCSKIIKFFTSYYGSYLNESNITYPKIVSCFKISDFNDYCIA